MSTPLPESRLAAIESGLTPPADNASMTLAALTAWLRAAVETHGADRPWVGPSDPHSYRGFYDELAFALESTTLGASLEAAKKADGASYNGYKGDDYFTMGPDTPAWLAEYGCTGSPIGAVVLDHLLIHGQTSALVAEVRRLRAANANLITYAQAYVTAADAFDVACAQFPNGDATKAQRRAAISATNEVETAATKARAELVALLARQS